MGWTAHKIVLQLHSPLHLGAGKVGNLQRTRPYVSGRNLWGALTARLSRDRAPGGAPDPQAYGEVGKRVHEQLAFTYLYPTTSKDGSIDLWLWGNESLFRYRFLSTYASTALNYESTSAEEASLHEVECLTPHTRDGEQVYLTGYIFEQAGSGLDWRGALTRLQIGGEQGYGWGRVTPVSEESPQPADGVFGYELRLDGKRPVVEIPDGKCLLAHALAAGAGEPAFSKGIISGPVEPLVGRETTPETRFGVRLSAARICYAPGSRVRGTLKVQIGPYGLWEAV